MTASRCPILAQHFRLLQHQLRRPSLFVGRIAKSPQNAFDDDSHIGSDVFADGPINCHTVQPPPAPVIAKSGGRVRMIAEGTVYGVFGLLLNVRRAQATAIYFPDGTNSRRHSWM